MHPVDIVYRPGNATARFFDSHRTWPILQTNQRD
jgi:hypothetical protein